MFTSVHAAIGNSTTNRRNEIVRSIWLILEIVTRRAQYPGIFFVALGRQPFTPLVPEAFTAFDKLQDVAAALFRCTAGSIQNATRKLLTNLTFGVTTRAGVPASRFAAHDKVDPVSPDVKCEKAHRLPRTTLRWCSGSELYVRPIIGILPRKKRDRARDRWKQGSAVFLLALKLETRR